MKIKDSVAIVTGGASGIGKAFADLMAELGAKVVIVDLDTKTSTVTVEELKKKHNVDDIMYCHCDISKEDDWKAVFELVTKSFGKPQIIINNAGITGEVDIERTIQTNLIGTVHGTILGMRTMSKESGGEGGVIINIASAQALSPQPNTPVYAGTKAAILHFTRSFAVPEHFNIHGVRLNVICPGLVDTPFIDNLQPHQAYFIEEFLADFKKSWVPARPRDIALSSLKLIEDDTLNGKAILVTAKQGVVELEFKHWDLK